MISRFFFASLSFSLCHIFVGQSHHKAFAKVFLLLAVGQRLDRAKAIDYVSGFTKVNFIQGVPDFVLHFFNHLANVGNMRRSLTHRSVLFNLSGQGSAQVHGSRSNLVGLQPQHGGGGEIVVSRAPRTLFLDLNDMNPVPTTFSFLRFVPGLFT